jgi:hypothetical protein
VSAWQAQALSLNPSTTETKQNKILKGDDERSFASNL